METLHGLVEHIVYHNENNGYTVLALSLIHIWWKLRKLWRAA